MQGLIVSAVLLGLGVAITSPTSVLAVFVLLETPSGIRRGICFVVGWIAAIAVIALVLAVFPALDFHSSHTTPARGASAAELLLGLSLIAGGWVVARRPRPEVPRDPIPPRLSVLIDRHPSLAVGAGAFMLTYSITVVAALEVLKADVGPARRVLAMASFALASITTIVAPIVVTVVWPDGAVNAMAAGRAWLTRHSRTISVAMLVLIGIAIASKAAYDLLTG